MSASNYLCQPSSHAFGMHVGGKLLGCVTYGTPASRHLQMGACPSDPGKVIELNRLWLDDSLPRNSESWFVSRTLKMLPPRIVVSYADPIWGHYGYIYRALNFHYAGWTDMERKTPRYDYIPLDPSKHTREAFRDGPGLDGVAYRRRRVAKVKYWTVTGNPTDRKVLTKLCGWPRYDWRQLPPHCPVDTLGEHAPIAIEQGGDINGRLELPQGCGGLGEGAEAARHRRGRLAGPKTRVDVDDEPLIGHAADTTPGCFAACLLACADERYDDMCDDCYGELIGGAA